MSDKNKRSRADKDVSGNEDTGNRNNTGGLNSAEDLPGYPHYPPEEDIMNPANRMEKLAADDENLTRSGAFVKTGKKETGPVTNLPDGEEYDGLGIVRGTEADLTKDDLLILGPKSGDQDMGDDEFIKANARPDNVEDDELDIPGAELDDENEEIGEEDEENNYYSLGGDRHENLEEDQ